MVMHQDEFQTTESLSVYLKQRRNQYGHKRSKTMHADEQRNVKLLEYTVPVVACISGLISSC